MSFFASLFLSFFCKFPLDFFFADFWATKPVREGLAAQKTKKAQAAYRQEHEADLLRSEAAVRFFKANGITKFPPKKKLTEEIEALLSEKNAGYTEIWVIILSNAVFARGTAIFNCLFPLFFPLQIQDVLYKALHPGRAVLLHLLSEVGVPVESESRRSMAQVPLNSFDVVPCPDRVHGVCMAAVMEPGTLQTGRRGSGGKLICHPVMAQWPARGVGEYQTVWIVPEGTSQEAAFGLLLTPGLQHHKRRCRRGDGPGLAALRGNEKAGFPVLSPGELLVDVDHAFIVVHGIPGEAQQLRDP